MSHEPYVRWLSRYFYAAGYDAEDMAQEARLAMWLCPDAPRTAARYRLIEIVRRSKRAGRPEFCELEEAADPADVVDLVAVREWLRAILAMPLSDLERVALGRVIRGEPCSEKALDNALQRARRKVAA